MTAECRPPDGTPDGTVCFVALAGGEPFVRAIWHGGAWKWPHVSPQGRSAYWPAELAETGWRFHSIAHPPGEHQPRETRDE